ncbi:MAG: hypothetical protein DI589_02340 [Shinella sp.]|nr:MAG: hypothetical protein DI589_02340 [Shinella sp.]
MKQGSTTDELDTRLGELGKAGDRLNDEFGKCFDRASLLISVAKSLGIDQLNAAKVGLPGPRFDIGDVFKGINDELANARLCENSLKECTAELRDLHKVKRASR